MSVNSTSLISIFQVAVLSHHLLIDIHPPVMEKKALDAVLLLSLLSIFYQFLLIILHHILDSYITISVGQPRHLADKLFQLFPPATKFS